MDTLRVGDRAVIRFYGEEREVELVRRGAGRGGYWWARLRKRDGSWNAREDFFFDETFLRKGTPEKHECSICRGVHGSEITHACE